MGTSKHFKSVKAELKKTKAALRTYDPSPPYLSEKHDTVVSILNFKDNITATKTSVKGLGKRPIACIAMLDV